MKACSDWDSLLEMWLDRELSEELMQSVEQHLEECGVCQAEIARREEARSLLRESLNPVTTPPNFRERTAAKLYDRFAEQLHPIPAVPEGQWSLPLMKEEEE
jgi:anti-sigma factor RsiW